MAAALALDPPTTFAPFSGPATTVEYMRKAVLGPRGERSMVLRSFIEGQLSRLRPKDYLSEILAIRNIAATRLRYVNDPLTTELVKDPQRITEEILQRGMALTDCDDIATFIAGAARTVGREADWVTVGFRAPGVYSHIFARVKEPKTGKWIVCDPVAGTDEAAMLRRVKTYKIWSID